MKKEEKEVVQENKKGKGKTIIIIILILMILGLSGYIVYDKILNTEKETNKEQEKIQKNVEEKESSVLKEDQKENINKKMAVIMSMDDVLDTPHFGCYYENEKMLAFDMKNQEKIFLALRNIEPTDTTTIPSEEALIFTKEEVEKSMKSLFGTNIKYTHAYTSKEEGISRKYNQKNQTYEVKNTNSGSVFGRTTAYKIIEYKKEKEEIKVYVKSAIILADFNTEETSKIYNPSHKIGSDSKKDLVASNIKWNDALNMDSYIDKLDTYIFTFKMEDDNYYFYSVELEK